MGSNTPIRIQRKRTKGWKMPPNTVSVCRPGLWGNPFVVGEPSGHAFNDGGDPEPMIPSLSLAQSIDFYETMMSGMLSPEMHPHGHVWISLFRKHIKGCSPAEWARQQLRGKNLACFCALDQPCHADVLLKLANGAPR